MMTENGTMAAIDVGTTKICTVVGRRLGKRGVEVLGHSTVPCSGLRKGNVSDIAATATAVRESVEQVESSTGHSVGSAYIGVTGSHVTFENSRHRLTSPGELGVITNDDLLETPESWNDQAEPGRKVIHAIRMSYSLDGETGGIRNPVGMHSREVDVDTHVVTGGAAVIGRLLTAVGNADVEVDELVLEPLASGLAVLTEDEKEEGAVLVDIGGGTTDVVGFWKGRICYTAVIPVGGFQFTNDIAITYNTPYEAAEEVKIEYGSADLPTASTSGDEISLPVMGNDMGLKVQRLEICQLLRERAQELSRLIKLRLDDEAPQAEWARRIVLTGGTSNLPGLAALMQRNLAIPVRQGIPTIKGLVPDELKSPSYATSLGMLMWAANDRPHTAAASQHSNGKSEAAPGGFMAGIARWAGKLTLFTSFAAKKGRI